jgi:hypothetical protein
MTDHDLSQAEQDELNRLRETAQVGMDAEAFKNTPLGQWMINKAKEERQGIVEALILADPTDTKTIADLQGKAVLLGLFEEWLNQAITDGIEALQYFKQYED